MVLCNLWDFSYPFLKVVFYYISLDFLGAEGGQIIQSRLLLSTMKYIKTMVIQWEWLHGVLPLNDFVWNYNKNSIQEKVSTCHRSAKTPIPLSNRYKFMMSLFQAHTHKIKQTKHRETKADQDKPQLRKCSKHSIQWMVWQLLLFKTSQILSTDVEIVFLILTPSTIGFVELVWDLVWESDCVKTATKTSSDRLQLLYSRAYLAEQTF